MMNRVRIGCLIGAAGLAFPAIAQDSVGLTNGLPGDAISAWDVSEQSNAYVVDLSPFFSSWGNEFGIAPFAKHAKSPDDAFFTHLSSANGLSRVAIEGGFASDMYSVWDMPGFGVNDEINMMPGTVDATGLEGVQLGYVTQYFDGFPSPSINTNIVEGGFINYEASNPARLYVTRIMAAHSGQDPAGAGNPGDNAGFGVGDVDASGNVVFRADPFGTVGVDALTGNNWYRVDMAARDLSSINEIRNAGPQDGSATDHIVVNSATTHITPTQIPAEIAGRSVVGGTNFDSEYVFEIAPETPAFSTAHLNGSSEDRGNTHFTNKVIFDDTVGTMAALGLRVGGEIHEDDARSILLWGVDANGNYVDGINLELPMSITDNDDGFNTNDSPVSPGTSDYYFGNFQSQMPFRGGNGQVAVSHDQRGNLLVAAQVFLGDDAFSLGDNEPLRDDTPMNAIAVARFPGGDITATPEWTLAAYTDTLPLGVGKEIKDGPGGSAVGRLTDLVFVTEGAPVGPSISAPAFDAAGNVYFVAAIENFDGMDQFDTALIRAVYNQDEYKYELERMFSLGFVFDGLNSGTPYQVQFLPLVDSNSAGSGMMTSNNVTSGAVGNGDNSALATEDPRNLGGLIVNADIVYDVDGDGDFDDPSAGGGDPTSGDESYNVLLYVGATEALEAACPADCNGDGNADILDFVCFQGLFQAGDPAADCNDDGELNILDFVCFQTLFQSCL